MGSRYSELAEFAFNNIFVREDITIRRTVTGSNIKVGWLKIFKSQLVFDYFLGGGIKFRNIKHLERQAPGDLVENEFVRIERNREGSMLMGNLVIGFKLGYLIR